MLLLWGGVKYLSVSEGSEIVCVYDSVMLQKLSVDEDSIVACMSMVSFRGGGGCICPS